ncbi:MAG: DNA replication and repair protein RecF [Treponema sp.]|jgi:DNA replication and repair protein RecF|nr:DNA replication and repair protein RecF [Treponema sp.]
MAFAFFRTAAFRNLVDEELDVRGKDIFLVGENGQGKTNFLEALYFCAYASSFRGSRDGEMVRNGEKDCSVLARLENPLYEKICVKIERGRKTVELDGKRLEDRKELLAVIPCIVFCHEDMAFVSGTPEDRRWFFDQTQSLTDPAYLEDLRHYRRVLKIRNLVFRSPEYGGPLALNSAGEALLDTLDPQLAEYGLKIMGKRKEAACQFSAVFGPLYEDVAGISGITVSYSPSWKDGDMNRIIEGLAGRRAREKAAGVSLSGPHRDRYQYHCDGGEFSAQASTGQRRLLALLLRSAQARRFSAQTGRNPVLLLDDVLLELDPEKRRRFLAHMPSYDQAFYTFLPEEPIERYQKGDTLVFAVEEGRIRPVPG